MMTRLFFRSSIAAMILLAVLALTGCGQKGDLYIPAGDKPEQPGSS